MWETTRIDPSVVANLNRAAGVIVPCHEVERWFRESGVTAPIAVVPLGYDPEVFIPGAPQSSGRLRFGCAGRTKHGRVRKGLDEVLEAFLEAFPTDAGVELHVKCWPDCTVKTTGDPRIVVNRQSLSIESLANWYRSIDVFVSASRGEGFGLQPLQAMACGIPHIAPVWGGHRAYMTPSTGWAVDFHEEPAEGDIYGGLGNWCIPHRESLVKLMREAADDREGRRAKGREAEIRALDFTWDHAGPILVQALRDFGLIPRPPGTPR
jgi:glycosyltransferase involved in cell wall biosynthesis